MAEDQRVVDAKLASICRPRDRYPCAVFLVVLASDDKQINHEVRDREVAGVVAQLSQVVVSRERLVHRAEPDTEGDSPLLLPR